MSVKQAQREIDRREFVEWMAYAQVEPWDETRADVRTAIIAHTIANIWRGPETPPYTLETFMPRYEPIAEEPVDSDDLIAQQQQLLESLTRAVGGAVH